ncbi:MAG: hypothetical protein L6R39_006748 [Caloplaca ligustica]|nr:MAG: hypothetical protein L6R39_006748 [Caloplaca ligustica]
MSEELKNEVDAINAIYGEDTIRKASNLRAAQEYSLVIPTVEVTLRLSIPDGYPEACLKVTAVDTVGSTARKGFGNYVLITAREVLQRVFTPGQVCLYDLLQELEQILCHESSNHEEEHADRLERWEEEHIGEAKTVRHADASIDPLVAPHWALSTTITEKRSVFLARACPVNSIEEVQSAITHLIATDKRASKATHNISAYRIRGSVNSEVGYQDYNDDGEDAAGGRLLKLMQMMDVWNVLVVVSRWYGGIKLGPARFGIINAVAREAVVTGGFVKG